MNSYETHPYLHHCPVAVGSDDAHGLRLRDGDFVVAVFTLANTVSGRATELAWFQGLLGHVSAQGATPHVFVDAALSGCVMVASGLNFLYFDVGSYRVSCVL